MLGYIRIFLTAIWVALSCLIGIIIGLLRPFDPRNVKIICTLLGLSRYILGIKFELRNAELLEKSRPCVFISNHQDNMDVFPGSFTVPKYTVTIGKKSILYIPFFGLFFWLSGNLLIDRSNKKKAFETMDTAANAIKNKKLSVWIMPEGTRSKGRGVLPFKKGPFLTAIKAQVPIVPVAISSYTSTLNLNKFHSGKIIIDVLPPISTAGLTTADVNQIKDQAFHVIAHAVSVLDKELACE
jgi:1-acyl-sn-glycerol-3-phosphate acyltransferase